MSMGIIASVGGALIGGVVSSRNASKAAKAQTDAAAQSDATQRYQYDTTRADNAPFRETGLNANNALAYRMGLTTVAPSGSNAADYGAFTRKFGASDLANDAVYQSGLQFGADQGAQGINRQAAAGGSFLSGATLKALTRFGTDYGSTKANESYNRFNADQTSQYNRFAGISGAGQQATNNVSAAGQNMANNISQSQQNAGDARASGYVGQANAINGVVGAGVNAFNAYNAMGRSNVFAPAVSDGGYSAGTGAAYGGSRRGL